jgi:hypothetical protein
MRSVKLLLAAAVAIALAVPGVASAADTLLSQGKPVTVSSSGGCCPGPNAVDGSTSTRWASASNADPQWIYVDLGGTFAVHRVQLTWDLSCATAYRVEISPDHVNWTSMFSTTAGKGGVENLTGLSGTGRYVRMFGTKRCRSDSSHGYSLQEFQVFGGAGDVTPPSPPGMPSLVGSTSASVTIQWTAASDDVGVAGYDVFHDGQLCAQTTAATLTATCDGLSPT